MEYATKDNLIVLLEDVKNIPKGTRGKVLDSYRGKITVRFLWKRAFRSIEVREDQMTILAPIAKLDGIEYVAWRTPGSRL